MFLPSLAGMSIFGAPGAGPFGHARHKGGFVPLSHVLAPPFFLGLDPVSELDKRGETRRW